MGPKYTLKFDAERCFLRVTISGHWLLDDLAAYDKAQRDELERLAALGFGPLKTGILIDARGQGPQSQDVVAALGVIFQAPIYRARQVAVLQSSALLAMQARRVDAQSRVFTNEDEAIAWLTSTGQPRP